MTLEETKIFQTIAILDGGKIVHCNGWGRLRNRYSICSSDYKMYLWYPSLYIVCSHHDTGDDHKALISNARPISSLEDLSS